MLSTVKWQYAFVYIDDIVKLSRFPEENIKHAVMVLWLLKNADVVAKLQKCAFLTNNINYLGHVIRPSRLEITHHTVSAVSKAMEPGTVIEL